MTWDNPKTEITVTTHSLRNNFQAEERFEGQG